MSSSENLSSSFEANEKCGVFATFTPHENSTSYTLNGISQLQHRGQDGAGIVSINGSSRIFSHRGVGHVKDIFTEGFDLSRLPGEISLGHTRYGTSTKSTREGAHAQPVISSSERIAIAHNGNLPDTTDLENFLEKNGVPTYDFNDTELLHAGLEFLVQKGATLEEAIEKTYPLLTGAWSIAAIDRKKEAMVAARDPYGIRPLSVGQNKNGVAFTSETVAFEPDDFPYMRDVKPGEMVTYDGQKLTSTQYAKGQQKLDIFEFVYFASPNSELLGRNVGEVRKNLGRQLAYEMQNEKKLDIDCVIGVPNSGLLAAVGFSEVSGIELSHGLVKRPDYKRGRTFIAPSEQDKIRMVKEKLEARPELVNGKNIFVIDDSIVRGNTFPPVVEMLRKAGARKIHAGIVSPPVAWPDYYGINTPKKRELIANRFSTIDEISERLGVDSLNYLSLNGMLRATELPGDVFSTSAFTGEYPSPIGKRQLEIGIPHTLSLHSQVR